MLVRAEIISKQSYAIAVSGRDTHWLVHSHGLPLPDLRSVATFSVTTKRGAMVIA